MGRFLKSLTVMAVVALLPFRAEAQTRDISGKVTQIGTGQPIADVTVGIVGLRFAAKNAKDWRLGIDC